MTSRTRVILAASAVAALLWGLTAFVVRAVTVTYGGP